MLYPGEQVIGDHNYYRHIQPYLGSDGQYRAKGLIPRNYQSHPVGCYASALPFSAVDFPLIPRSEWKDRIKDKVAAKANLSDIILAGNNGQPIPSLDQGNKGYCWAHSSTACVMFLRAVANMPYVGLSAYAIACIEKNYRDEGGWGAESMDFLMARGVPSEKYWPMQSMSRSNDNRATWENAALHKVTEGFIDLQAAQYDRNLSFEQEISLLLVNTPTVKDLNWWGHSVAGTDAVDGETQRTTCRTDSGKLATLEEFEAIWGMNDPVTAGIGVRFRNSWGDQYGHLGFDVLTGSKAVSDGGVAPRVTIPSNA